MTRIAILTKYYQATLSAMPRSSKAMAYAKGRHLDYGKLGIGYSGGDIGRKWNKSLHESGAAIGVLQKSGSSYRPKIRYCLMFAMKNQSGQVVDVYGRSIGDVPGSKHFYRSGKQQGLYPGYPSLETTKLILTESIIDAASLEQYSEITKEYGVVALYGGNGFTAEHGGCIQALPKIEEVILFMDGDAAGQKAIKKWAPEIQQLKEGMKVSYVSTPEDEDINSLIQSHEPEILTHLLQERKPVTEDANFLFSIEKRKIPKAEEAAKEQLDKLDITNVELLTYQTQEVQITILGGIKITGLDRMRVTVKVERRATADNPNQGSRLPVRHSLDLYHAKQVDHLSELMASGLELRSSRATQIISDMTTVIRRLSTKQIRIDEAQAREGL